LSGSLAHTIQIEADINETAKGSQNTIKSISIENVSPLKNVKSKFLEIDPEGDEEVVAVAEKLQNWITNQGLPFDAKSVLLQAYASRNHMYIPVQQNTTNVRVETDLPLDVLRLLGMDDRITDQVVAKANEDQRPPFRYYPNPNDGIEDIMTKEAESKSDNDRDGPPHNPKAHTDLYTRLQAVAQSIERAEDRALKDPLEEFLSRFDSFLDRRRNRLIEKAK